MNKRYSRSDKFALNSKSLRMGILFLSFIILFGALATTLIKTFDQTELKNKQLASLEIEVIKERAKNAELLKEKGYYSSDTFIEKEARNTLGYSYPNETLYILKRPAIAATPTNTSKPTVAVDENPKILDKWLNLIFGD